jgi:hypothetical protein
MAHCGIDTPSVSCDDPRPWPHVRAAGPPLRRAVFDNDILLVHLAAPRAVVRAARERFRGARSMAPHGAARRAAMHVKHVWRRRQDAIAVHGELERLRALSCLAMAFGSDDFDFAEQTGHVSRSAQNERLHPDGRSNRNPPLPAPVMMICSRAPHLWQTHTPGTSTLTVGALTSALHSRSASGSATSRSPRRSRDPSRAAR